MIIDGRHVPSGSTQTVDVCVIGAGPAGILLADRLAEQTHLEIALMESGDLHFDPDIQNLARGDVDGQSYFPLVETRIRRFGGTSWSWGGVLASLDPIDFEERAWVPDSGWPFSIDDLANHIRDALEICGFSQEESQAEPSVVRLRGESESQGLKGSKGWLEAGELPTGPSWVMSDISSDSQPRGAANDVSPTLVYYRGPIRFGRIFVDRFRESDRVKVYLRSAVTRLDVNEAGSAVAKAQVSALDGPRWMISARLFVLAAGGIENPRLLLASNDAHKAGLGNSRDLVGRFFMEHPKVVDRIWLPKEVRRRDDLLQMSADKIHFGRLSISGEIQRREELLNYFANVYVGFAGQDGPQWESVRRIAIAARRPWNESPYLQDARGGRMGFYWDDFRTALKHPFKSATSIVGAGLRPKTLRRYIDIDSSIEQPPLSDNRVILDTKKDPLGVQLPRLEWTVGESVRHTYERGLKMIMSNLESRIPGLREQRFERGDWPRDIIGTWHHMGTTRMHQDPAKGVVDRHCRVHDVDNLYVAGSSVFPTGGATAPTLTIIALALRLADRLAQELSR